MRMSHLFSVSFAKRRPTFNYCWNNHDNRMQTYLPAICKLTRSITHGHMCTPTYPLFTHGHTHSRMQAYLLVLSLMQAYLHVLSLTDTCLHAYLPTVSVHGHTLSRIGGPLHSLHHTQAHALTLQKYDVFIFYFYFVSSPFEFPTSCNRSTFRPQPTKRR